MEVGSSSLPGTTSDILISDLVRLGGLAQLARAPALQAGGQRFESVILHDPDMSVMCSGNHNYSLLIANYSLGKRSLTY